MIPPQKKLPHIPSGATGRDFRASLEELPSDDPEMKSLVTAMSSSRFLL
jgi:hypothetical protein